MVAYQYGGNTMRQTIGLLIATLSLISFIFFIRLTMDEMQAINGHKEIITNSVDLSMIESIKPLTIVDRNGTIYSEEYVEWRKPISFENIPTIVKQIFLLSEDEHFYSHIGFDVSAISRALVANSKESSIQQGGSTITQQLVRMRYLSEEKTYERKLMELFYSYELEKNYSKDQIFEMYLNEAYFSNQVYGINSAATYYFSKPIHELTIAEVAFISAIPNNPSLYDPLKNFTRTKERQERLLDTLVNKQVISFEEGKQLKAQPIELNIKEKIQKHPAYTTYVLNELKQLIAAQEQLTVKNSADESKVNAQVEARYKQLLQSGATIYTALDPDKQTHDEQTINDILSRYDIQGSATVIDNDTREIVSVYAGKDYKKFELHRAFQAYRQPGSAFKPIAAYGPFLNETGYTTNYIVSGGKYCVGNYCPSNYGGGMYGNVPLLTAFKHSYNTSALRLVHSIGLEKSFNYIKQFHFEKITNADFTYAASLGGLKYGVTTSELANAYTSFIDGSYRKAVSIRQVVDMNGNIVYSWPKENKMIWNSKTTSKMRTLLQEVVSSGTGVGLHSNGSYIGAKTGTTNNFHDFWLAGLNDQYTTAVWIGYDIPASMEQYEKHKVHFRIFNAIMND